MGKGCKSGVMGHFMKAIELMIKPMAEAGWCMSQEMFMKGNLSMTSLKAKGLIITKKTGKFTRENLNRQCIMDMEWRHGRTSRSVKGTFRKG